MNPALQAKDLNAWIAERLVHPVATSIVACYRILTATILFNDIGIQNRLLRSRFLTVGKTRNPLCVKKKKIIYSA